MSTQSPDAAKLELPGDARVGVVAARFNARIVDEMLAGCILRLNELGFGPGRIETYRVPGAFELPFAAQALARTGRLSAVICIGCVIRGDTPHFDYVAGECARGIQQVSQSEHLPVIFGVLTTNTEAQAWDRVGGPHGHAGQRAADAAGEMIDFAVRLSTEDAARREKSR